MLLLLFANIVPINHPACYSQGCQVDILTLALKESMWWIGVLQFLVGTHFRQLRRHNHISLYSLWGRRSCIPPVCYCLESGSKIQSLC